MLRDFKIESHQAKTENKNAPDALDTLREFLYFSLNLESIPENVQFSEGKEEYFDKILLELICETDLLDDNQIKQLINTKPQKTHSFGYYFRRLLNGFEIIVKQFNEVTYPFKMSVTKHLLEFDEFYSKLSREDIIILNSLNFNNLYDRLNNLNHRLLDKNLIYLARAAIRAFYWQHEKMLNSMHPNDSIKNTLVNRIFEEFSTIPGRVRNYCAYRDIKKLTKIRSILGDSADRLFIKMFSGLNEIFLLFFDDEFIKVMGPNFFRLLIKSKDDFVRLNKSRKEEVVYNIIGNEYIKSIIKSIDDLVYIMSKSRSDDISCLIRRLTDIGYIGTLVKDIGHVKQALSNLQFSKLLQFIKITGLTELSDITQDTWKIDETSDLLFNRKITFSHISSAETSYIFFYSHRNGEISILYQNAVEKFFEIYRYSCACTQTAKNTYTVFLARTSNQETLHKFINDIDEVDPLYKLKDYMFELIDIDTENSKWSFLLFNKAQEMRKSTTKIPEDLAEIKIFKRNT